MAVMPAPISSPVLNGPLFCPIITIASLGEMPSTLPCCKRQSTCSVRSPVIPQISPFRFS